MAGPDAPDAATLAWVARSVGGDEVVRLRRLTGGIATATHLLTLRSGRRVVLRRHAERWVKEDPEVVAGEVEVLGHLARLDLPAPRLLAADATGAETGGRPAMVLARLAGRIELAPPDPPAWLRQMAEALARVHAAPAPPSVRSTSPSVPPPWMERPGPPSWSTRPALWERALTIVWDEPAPPPPPGRDRPVLVHGDYQHYNLLWSRGRLTGIVDWSPPHGRPLDSDLGHCRLNLVLLYGTDAADRFLRAYEAVTGLTVDPWWDLLETVSFLPTWADTIRRQVGSRIPFDADAMHRRVDAHLPTLLARC